MHTFFFLDKRKIYSSEVQGVLGRKTGGLIKTSKSQNPMGKRLKEEKENPKIHAYVFS